MSYVKVSCELDVIFMVVLECLKMSYMVGVKVILLSTAYVSERFVLDVDEVI